MPTAPLTVVMRNPSTNISISLSNQLEQIQISTAAPGGFGTFTFRISERPAGLLAYPIQSFYACDVSVTDVAAQTLFEGVLTDVKMHSDATSAYYECECTGWQILLDNPYRNMVIERNLDFEQMNVGFNPNLCRPDLIQLTTGQTSPTDPTKIGFRMDSGTLQVFPVAGTFPLNGVQLILPKGLSPQIMYLDYNVDLNHTTTFDVEYTIYNDAGASVGTGTAIGTGTVASGSGSITLSGGSQIYIYMVNQVGGTPSANCFAQFTNIAVVCARIQPTGASVTTSTVYGHECVSDILSRSQLALDYSGIEIDTSYVVPEFSYPSSDTGRNALTAITAFYNRYWAVWENKKFFWKSWNTTTADWTVSRDSGALVDIDPSIVDSANVVRVQYTDAAGIAQEVDVPDQRQDNIYKLAGRIKTVIVDLGEVSTSVAAPQVGSVFFPDHSYEVVGGSITMPAQTRCFSQTYGNMRPAYLIRAGESVRLRDGSSVRSIFDNQSWNRATFFRVTATDLDWEAQTITLTIDNSQASLDQLTARIATNQSSKYGT